MIFASQARPLGQDSSGSGFVQFKSVVASASNRSKQIKAIQGGLKQTGMPEAKKIKSTGALDKPTMTALNAYLKATQRPPMTPAQVLANLGQFAEELDVQRFTFDGAFGAGYDPYDLVACPQIWGPVIAADGRRFDNECLARRALAPPPYQRTSEPMRQRWSWFPSTFPMRGNLGLVTAEPRAVIQIDPASVELMPYPVWGPIPSPWYRRGIWRGGMFGEAAQVNCSADGLECWQSAFPQGGGAESGPVAGMQRAVDNFFQVATASSAVGVTFQIDGESVMAGVPTAPLAPSGYDGIVDGRTAGWTGFAIAIASDLSDPPPGADAASTGDPREVAGNAEEIGFYLDAVSGRLDELVANYTQAQRNKKIMLASAGVLGAAVLGVIIYGATRGR